MSETGQKFISALIVFVFIGGIIVFFMEIFSDPMVANNYLPWRTKNSLRQASTILEVSQTENDDSILKESIKELNKSFQKAEDDQEEKFIYVGDFPEFDALCLLIYNNQTRKVPFFLYGDSTTKNRGWYESAENFFRGEKP